MGAADRGNFEAVGYAAHPGEGDKLRQHVEGLVAVGQCRAAGFGPEGFVVGLQAGFEIRGVEVQAAWAGPETVGPLEYEIVLEEAARAPVLFDQRNEAPQIGFMGYPGWDGVGVGVSPFEDSLDLLEFSHFPDADAF